MRLIVLDLIGTTISETVAVVVLVRAGDGEDWPAPTSSSKKGLELEQEGLDATGLATTILSAGSVTSIFYQHIKTAT